ncbi:sensor histidine kinase [Fictibacillus phosphorivorans]|uniref:sensor histidine kinase n=1 Tax=Fictibacillus phosphorivorans TaxID=1221500 RepID=UPI00203ED5C6|nr:HAMP domain-containing sensor histidine kinase [Fictibacillus phosphorivorans]MCM3717724.1 HAMP domain-containing histidine kinase [Fictibacillus phosphorivorans]MCM3775624.1 HAMP domain-containing histidine kinase [Fictibacillus phosphorivorans]
MKTLYRKFIIATLMILGISILLSFLLTNWVYVTSTKGKIDSQNVMIAEEIANGLEHMHSSASTYKTYLNSMSKLGYQLYIVNETGDGEFFGQPFKRTELPEEAEKVLTDQKVYHGMESFAGKFLMMGHFSNDLKNTVGVPFTMENQNYGLFLRPNNNLIFSDIHMIFAWFFVAIAVVSIIGVIVFAKHLIKPISKLTEATKEITRENFNFPLNIERKDEIGQLAESFSRMQKQLQHNDEARKSFINNVSHDFQSPLMNIQGYAELLQTQQLSDEEHFEYVQIIDQESKRLSNLTKQLLLLTSLDQGSYPMQLSEVRLDEQIKETIRRHQWRLEEKEIEVSYKLAPVTFKGDPELLVNIWDNLLTNAIKYNSHGGSILISLSQTPSEIKVVVKDTGIGISAHTIDQIFDRFYRVDSARKKDGTGLGLSIVKQIIELHNGDIQAESQAGQGTSFTITFFREKQR